MIITEMSAKSRACPEKINPNCLATGCMAWVQKASRILGWPTADVVGSKIPWIKEFRAITGCGLKEAVDAANMYREGATRDRVFDSVSHVADPDVEPTGYCGKIYLTAAE